MSWQSVELLPQLRIGTRNPRIQEALALVYGPLSEGEADVCLELSGEDLLWNGVPLMPVDAADLPPLLESLVNHRIGLEPDYLLLHAGHVHWRGQDLLLAGDRGSGKSTLAALLVGEGAAYGSDELTALSLTGAGMFSVYKALTVKCDHSPLAVEGDLGWQDPFRGALQYPHPTPRADAGMDAPLVLFPVYDPDAVPSVYRLEAGLAFLALGQQVFGGLLRDPRRCDRLAELAENGRVYRLVFRSSEEALEQLDAIVDAEGMIPLACDVAAPPQDVHHPARHLGGFPDRELRSVWTHSRVALQLEEACAVFPQVMERWLDLVEGHRLQGVLGRAGSLLHAAAPAQLRAEARRAIRDLQQLDAVLRDLGPDAIVLKGSSYLQQVYPYAAQRDWTDVDVLCLDTEEANATFEALQARGYQVAMDLGAHHHLPALRHPVLPVSIEIHTDLAVPPLGEEIMAWFAARVTDGEGCRMLNREALAVLTAVHALNDPVDSPLLRQLLEFACLDMQELALPDHPLVIDAVERCRRFVRALEGGDFVPGDAMDRAMMFSLQVPALTRRTPFLRWKAAVHRRWIEKWHEGRRMGVVSDQWAVLKRDSSVGLRTPEIWERQLGGHRVCVRLNSGEMSLSQA